MKHLILFIELSFDADKFNNTKANFPVNQNFKKACF